jgi:hypothetical protein
MIQALVKCLGYAVAGLVILGIAKTIRFFWRGSQSPLHELAGPLHDLGVSLEGDFHDFRDTFVRHNILIFSVTSYRHLFVSSLTLLGGSNGSKIMDLFLLSGACWGYESRISA